jgi:WD40 repeat protein
MDMSPLENTVAIEDSGQIQIVHTESGEPITSFETHRSDLYELSWSPDGRLLVGYEEGISIWAADSGIEVGRIDDLMETPDTYIMATDWLPDSSALAVALCLSVGDDNYCSQVETRLYDTSALLSGDLAAPEVQPAALKVITSLPGIGGWNIDISPDGGSLTLVSERDDVVQIVDVPWWSD